MNMKAFAVVAAVLSAVFVSSAEARDVQVEAATPTGSLGMTQYIESTWEEDATEDADVVRLDADGDRQAVFRDRYGRKYFDKDIAMLCPFFYGGARAETADECVVGIFTAIKELKVPHEGGKLADYADAYEGYANVMARMRQFEGSAFNVGRLRAEVEQARVMLALVDMGLRVGLKNLTEQTLRNSGETVFSAF